MRTFSALYLLQAPSHAYTLALQSCLKLKSVRCTTETTLMSVAAGLVEVGVRERGVGISDGKGVAKAGIEASSRELAAGRKCRRVVLTR